jgi:hypothetical protein
MATSPSIGESNANALDALLRISTERTFSLRRARLAQRQKSTAGGGFFSGQQFDRNSCEAGNRTLTTNKQRVLSVTFIGRAN